MAKYIATLLIVLFFQNMNGQVNDIDPEYISQVSLKHCDSIQIPLIPSFPVSEVSFSLKEENVFFSELSEWLNANDPLQIKTLGLYNVDTIHNALNVFKHVENLFVRSGRSIVGIGQFEHLKKVSLFMFNGELPEELTNIDLQVFYCESSEITNFNSLSDQTSIEEIFVGDAIVDTIPAPSSLLNLLRYEFISYYGPQIDLSTLNFKENRCLKVLTLASKFDNFTSIPLGVEALDLDKLFIYNNTLTELEKRFLGSLNNQDIDY